MNRANLWKMMENKIPNSILKTIKCIYRNLKVSDLMVTLYLNQSKYIKV
jgi:hypothetical protein